MNRILLALVLIASTAAAAADPTVNWGPLPPGWNAWQVQGQSSTPIASEGTHALGAYHLVLQSAEPNGWRAVIEIRLSTKNISNLESFAAEFAGQGLQRQVESGDFNGQPALHARGAGRTSSFDDWLILQPVRGGQPWVATMLSCAFSPGRPGYEQCQARRAELDQILKTIAFGGSPPARLHASILLPPDLKPGDVISPSAVVVDGEGRPPRGEIGVVWYFNRTQTNGLIWDGQPLHIELQASADGQALTAELSLPAYGSGPPVPVARTPSGVAVDGVVPGLNGIGDLPGPRNGIEALVGTLGPGALGLLGALLSGLLTAPGPLPQPPAPPQSPRRRRRPGDHGDADSAPDADDDNEDEKGDSEHPDRGGAPATTRRRRGGKDGDAAKPQPAPPPGPGDHVRRRLEQMRRIAERNGNRELKEAIDRAASLGFGANGRFNPEAWKAAQKELWAARDRSLGQIPSPNSALRDALGSGVVAVGSALGQGARAAGSMVGGLASLVSGGVRGAAAIGDAVVHLPSFVRGANDCVGQWADRNASTEKRIFTEGMRDGRVGDALIGLAMGGVKAGAGIAGRAASFIKKDVLPWEEVGALTNSRASLEEKLWAVPAAAAKIASLMTLGQNVGTQPATSWGRAIANASDRWATRDLAAASQAAANEIGRLEAQAVGFQRAAAGPNAAGVKGLLERTNKALEKARELKAATSAAQDVERLSRECMRGREAFQNYQQAQRALADNPQLSKAIDEALVANNGGASLSGARVRELIGQDAHTLMTARKLQLQNQALNQASKRIIEEEARALQAAGDKIPRRFDTFNATQGSRSRISGSNVNADLDQTVLGLKHVSREQAERIIQQECNRVGMTQKQLDINIYRPSKGLMDARGAAPNAQATLENIGQTSGTAGHHPVHVSRNGQITVGDHVSTPQGREAVLAGRRSMQPPPGVDREQWLWEGHQGAPVQVPKSQWAAVRQTQLEGIGHAFERGDMNQMVKYANRGRTVGLRMDDATAQLVRAVAGQKDPALAAQMLRQAGVSSPAELMTRLGLKP
ncbi:MAG: hypothetical protein AB7E72_04150 [Lysobacterales bacterium]